MIDGHVDFVFYNESSVRGGGGLKMVMGNKETVNSLDENLMLIT